MNLFRTVAALAAVAVVASGCNGDPKAEPTQAPSSSTTASLSPSVDPTPTATPTKPTLPDAATKPTKAGAEAFILHYWDVVNYVQATGHVRLLRQIVAATCDTCMATVDGYRKHYQAGGKITGGTATVEITETAPVKAGDSDIYSFKVTQSVKYTKQEITYGNGKVERPAATRRTWIAYVLWTKEGWRVDIQDVMSQ